MFPPCRRLFAAASLILLISGGLPALATPVTVVRVVDTSLHDPPSPDPAGIAYVVSSGNLLVADSEVNEIPLLFTGDNLFEMTTSGVLLDTHTSLAFPSIEPTGVTFNPSDGHLFFSDDDADEIFELDPGTDGLHHTADDVVTSFDTRDFLCFDPEGIAAEDTSEPTTVCVVATKDAFFREDAPNSGNGGGTRLKVKPNAGASRHIVVEFDLSEIPGNSEVFSSTLHLWEANKRSGQTIHVHRVANDWVESQVSWLERSAGNPWTTSGGDFDAPSVASFAPNISKQYREVDVTGVTQDWVDGVSANNGLLLRSEGANGEVKFKSREDGDFTRRPLLCVTYASERVLYIASGELNPEIYRVTPGSNGVFDGVAPLGDDVVTSFDIEADGFTDAEGVAIHPENGHLYVVGTPPTWLGEYATDGTLVRLFDISGTGAVAPAGLTFAPGSLDPSATNLYIAARGQDNNTHPNENDGKVYEVSLPGVTPGNDAPTVDAGADRVIALGDGVALAGTVFDDGLPNPPGTPTVRWRQVSGPGTAAFTNAGSEHTDASFSSSGTYVLRLAANDDELVTSDDVTITVLGAAGESVFEVRIASSSDDAEERSNPNGSVATASPDLEMVLATELSGENHLVGLRFGGIAVPPGSIIARAYVEFEADESNAEPTFLTIHGEAADDAATFAATPHNLSDRPETSARADWGTLPDQSIPEWVAGDAGPAQQTSDLSAVIQEIVDRDGWSSGNALALFVSSQVPGLGKRVAVSADGHPITALLHVEWIDPAAADDLGAIIDELIAIIDANPGSGLADKLQDAVASLQTGEDELAKEPPDELAAVGNFEGAVGSICDAVAEGLDADTGTGIMDSVAHIARQLAQDAIDHAAGLPHDADVLAEAQAFLAEGDALRDQGAADCGKFKDAINKYKDALSKAESSLP